MWNSESGYGWLAKSLHWLVALLMVGMSVVGFIFADMPRGDEKTELLTLHASFGLLLLAFMVVRLGVRMKGVRPRPLDPSATRLNALAHTVHRVLYLVIFLVIAAGMLTLMTVGWDVPFFGLFAVPTPFERDMALHHLFEEIHIYGWWVLAGLVALHLIGAMYHAFVLKDGTLRRMTREKSEC
ncbi:MULTISPECIES: cytochrome b [Kordiimonas]|jgi:cytochrome b561|uniref:cytochrome b n=1 Tax=Kordiimonas TaxID=288021 RepID=UPI00257BB1B1|nr:cytochrome b [Kordiimonas sp. UBA4487]